MPEKFEYRRPCWLAWVMGFSRDLWSIAPGLWLWSWALLTYLILSGCAPCTTSANDVAPGLASEEQRAAAVLITRACPTATAGEIAVSHASGVAVRRGLVLTAAHVVRCPGNPKAAPALLAAGIDGVERVADVVWREPLLDLAAIAVDGVTGHVSYDEPVEGAVVCSWPAWPERVHACGRVVSLGSVVTAANGVPDITFTLAAVPGNSGSGIYDERGRLIGLVTNANDPPPGGLASSVFGRAP